MKITEQVKELIALTLREDIGNGDHSSLSCIPAEAQGDMKLLIKQDGVLAGVDVAREVLRQVDENIRMELLLPDGTLVHKGDIAFTLHGSSRNMLTAERTLLNFMQRMSIFAHLMNPIHVRQLDEMIDSKEDFFLLDVRELPEYKSGTIEGATRYSVDELREFLEEIPEGKKIVVFCEVGLRGYVASRILMQNGFEEVYNLIGGMRTYRLTGRHNVIQN